MLNKMRGFFRKDKKTHITTAPPPGFSDHKIYLPELPVNQSDLDMIKNNTGYTEIKR